MKNDLSCEVVRDLLPSYIDGLTSPETSARIEAHLRDCEAWVMFFVLFRG